MTLSRAIHPAVVALAFWSAFATPYPLQAGTTADEEQPRPVFRAGTEAVRLDVIVTDRNGPIAGLTAGDFQVLDNDVAQKPTMVARGDSVTVLTVLDTSASVEGDRLRELVVAARTLVDRLRVDDRAGLLTFANRPLLRVPLADGGRGLPAISAALGTVRAGGLTALYDAVAAGLMLASPDAGGALLLLFSDGADTASYLKSDALLETVKHTGVVVYVVATGLPAPDAAYIPAESEKHERLLRSIAEASGGQLLRAEFSLKRLGDVFTRVLTEFRTRYVLTYIPEGVGRDDGWHSVKVSLRPGALTPGTSYRGVAVRVRSGYYASGPLGSSGRESRER